MNPVSGADASLQEQDAGTMRTAAIITAAGSSRRMGGGLKKEYRLLPGADGEDGKTLTVLGAAVSAFAGCEEISPIVIVHPAHPDQGEFAARDALGERLLSMTGRIVFVPGGMNRRLSVYHGLQLLKIWRPEFVLIHDGARPWIERALIERIIDGVRRHGAAIPVLPVSETPKTVHDGVIIQHLKRTETFAAQTPQAFRFDAILAAHEQAAEQCLKHEVEYTDDAEIYAAFTHTGAGIAAIEGDILNRKITFLYDLA